MAPPAAPTTRHREGVSPPSHRDNSHRSPGAHSQYSDHGPPESETPGRSPRTNGPFRRVVRAHSQRIHPLGHRLRGRNRHARSDNRPGRRARSLTRSSGRGRRRERAGLPRHREAGRDSSRRNAAPGRERDNRPIRRGNQVRRGGHRPARDTRDSPVSSLRSRARPAVGPLRHADRVGPRTCSHRPRPVSEALRAPDNRPPAGSPHRGPSPDGRPNLDGRPSPDTGPSPRDHLRIRGTSPLHSPGRGGKSAVRRRRHHSATRRRPSGPVPGDHPSRASPQLRHRVAAGHNGRLRGEPPGPNSRSDRRSSRPRSDDSDTTGPDKASGDAGPSPDGRIPLEDCNSDTVVKWQVRAEQ